MTNPTPHPALLAAAEAAFLALHEDDTFDAEALAIDAALGWTELVGAAQAHLECCSESRYECCGERLRLALQRAQEPRT